MDIHKDHYGARPELPAFLFRLLRGERRPKPSPGLDFTSMLRVVFHRIIGIDVSPNRLSVVVRLAFTRFPDPFNGACLHPELPTTRHAPLPWSTANADVLPGSSFFMQDVHLSYLCAFFSCFEPS